MIERKQRKFSLVRYSKNGKVIKMPVTAKKVSSRRERLAKAQQLSNRINKNTIAAEISYAKIENDVRKAFSDVKTSRRTDRNRL